jgi:DNA-binding response OmpR family regulator
MCRKSFSLPSGPRPKVLLVGDLVLNPATYDASRAGKEIALNRTEFRLLKFSMRRSGWVVSVGVPETILRAPARTAISVFLSSVA